MNRGIVDQSFLDDMNDAFMVESTIDASYGPVIDLLCEEVVTREGLFESKADERRKEKMLRILEGDENYDAVDPAELHGDDDDFDMIVDDGELIDQVMGDAIL